MEAKSVYAQSRPLRTKPKGAAPRRFAAEAYFLQQKTPEIRRFQVFRGAAGRIRTADLILTKDALYLLSYSSIKWRPGTGSNLSLIHI